MDDKKRELIEMVLESMPGALVTDMTGNIVYISESYAQILGTSPTAVIGKPAQELIPGSRMHITARTGQEEVGSMFKLKNGESIIVNRIPIKKDNKIIGAFAFSTLSKRNAINTLATIEGVKRLTQEISQYKSDLNKLRGAKYSLENIIGCSHSIVKIKELIKKVAQTKSTVLITGETGTGKEFVAHAIHQSSPRSHHPFIRLNCAAIPSELLESELFGYDEGAFTGAKRCGKLGKFEMANCGTIMLDEINQMPLYLQSKLLRVIQEKEIERVGGTKSIDIDVRLVCTTNQDLLELVNKGTFREDLYYRINVVTVDIPPLRARIEDIPLLAEHLICKINSILGLNISGIDDEVLTLFHAYYWPGNIRELEHSIERAANMALSGKLSLEHFENIVLRVENENANPVKSAGLSSTRAKAEKDAIIEALAQAGSIAKASKILHIHRSVLYDKIKKYGIKI